MPGVGAFDRNTAITLHPERELYHGKTAGKPGSYGQSATSSSSADPLAELRKRLAQMGVGGAAGGTGSGGTTMTSIPGSANPLTITSTADPNLDYLTDAYKKRLENDTTTRDIDRAASAARDMAAGMGAAADIEGSKTGMGKGYRAGSIGEAAQRYMAKSAADITSERQKQLDQLVLGGQGIMGASANLGLARQGLGLEAWKAQQDAALRQQQLNQQAQGTPLDWYKLIYGMI